MTLYEYGHPRVLWIDFCILYPSFGGLGKVDIEICDSGITLYGIVIPILTDVSNNTLEIWLQKHTVAENSMKPIVVWISRKGLASIALRLSPLPPIVVMIIMS